MEQRLTSATLVPVGHELLRSTRAGRTKVGWCRRTCRRTIPGVMALFDALLATLLWEMASLLQAVWGQGELTATTAAAMVPVVAVWVGMRALMGLYPGYGLGSAEELRLHTYSTFAALAALAVFALGFQIGNLLSRLLLGFTFIGLLFFAPLVRYCVKSGLKRMGVWGKPLVVLGYKETGDKVVGLLQESWELGYDPVAVVNFHLDVPGGPFEIVDSEQSLAGVIDLARSQRVDTAVFAMPYTRREQLAKLVGLATLSFRRVLVIPNLSEITSSEVVARDLAGTFAVEIRQTLLDPWPRRTKRILDLVGAVVGGLLISPLLVAIVLMIRVSSPGPAFYGHRRIGTEGEPFHCWKFRTMYPQAERLLNEYLQSNPHLRAEWEQNQKLRDDPRVTRVGRFLRSTSMDELPQLWNVLRGEMSLVGPRPIVDAEVPKYGEVYKLYKRIRPGMSGLWQVSGRSDSSYTERVAIDANYVRNWSFWLDLVILARTLKTCLLRRGAY